jgi:hypothetical protein
VGHPGIDRFIPVKAGFFPINPSGGTGREKAQKAQKTAAGRTFVALLIKK